MNLKLLFNDLITISLITAIIISVVALLYATLCKRYKSKWICLIWIVLAVRLIVPFNPEFTAGISPLQIPEPERTPISVPKAVAEYQQQLNAPPPIEQKPYDIRQIYGQDSTSNASSPKNSNETNSTTPPSANADTNDTPSTETIWIDSTILLCLAWLLGAVTAIIIRLTQLIRFKVFLKQNTVIVEDYSMNTILRHVTHEFSLHRNVRAYYCDRISSPMVTGIFKVKLLMPYMEYTEKELYAVIRHELSHVRLHHLEIKMLALVCEIIHWFNPFVYLMSKLLSRDLEFACDAKVLKVTSTTYREEYSKAILSVAGKVHSLKLDTNTATKHKKAS